MVEVQLRLSRKLLSSTANQARAPPFGMTTGRPSGTRWRRLVPSPGYRCAAPAPARRQPPSVVSLHFSSGPGSTRRRSIRRSAHGPSTAHSHGAGVRAPGSPAAVTNSGVLGNENLRPSSSMTLIWQVYCPGFRSLNGIVSLTGSTLSRLESNRVMCTYGVSITF
jgi:hypothetical protein